MSLFPWLPLQTMLSINPQILSPVFRLAVCNTWTLSPRLTPLPLLPHQGTLLFSFHKIHSEVQRPLEELIR
ncbi:hypothetical protein COOONC_04072 [Cooperia oncophora]